MTRIDCKKVPICVQVGYHFTAHAKMIYTFLNFGNFILRRTLCRNDNTTSSHDHVGYYIFKLVQLPI